MEVYNYDRIKNSNLKNAQFVLHHDHIHEIESREYTYNVLLIKYQNINIYSKWYYIAIYSYCAIKLIQSFWT